MSEYYEDIIPAAAAATGTILSLAGVERCQGIRFVTAGTFVGNTARGAARTVTGAVGAIVPVSFTTKAVGTADVELLI